MKILILTKYENMGASSRLRTYQYLPYLKAQGIDVTISPLLSNAYLQLFYQAKGRNKALVIKSYLKRLRTLFSIKSYDLIWIEKELFPMLPATIERLLCWIKVPYIVDYDDAIFHNYDTHNNSIIRNLLGKKIDTVMRCSALVTAGNDYLAERAQSAGASHIELIPTVIDIDRYAIVSSKPERPITIGWIGTPYTAKFLQQIRPALEKLINGESVRLLLVGSGQVDLGVPVEVHEWSHESEVQSIQQMDIGIMPLTDTPFERGKSGYKLIQYMGCGLPVVASPVGVNTQIVQDGLNGYLAASSEEWYRALKYLIDNPKERQTFGIAGRKIVEENYTLQITAPKLFNLIKQVNAN